jgi:hypothetical protein
MIDIIFLTMGKNVNPDNNDGWLRNRLRTFKGALGIMDYRCSRNDSNCPPQEAFAAAYTFLSAFFKLRRHFFRVCVSAARSTDMLAAAFREVIMFLQGVEMGHISMIESYIFGKYTELSRMRALRDNMEAMNREHGPISYLLTQASDISRKYSTQNMTQPLSTSTTLVFWQLQQLRLHSWRLTVCNSIGVETLLEQVVHLLVWCDNI